MFINYLIHKSVWNEVQLTYCFGKSDRTSKTTLVKANTVLQNEFISTSKEDHNIKVVTKAGLLWDTHQKEAIEKGNLIHNIMSQIKIKDDVDIVLNKFIDASLINREQSNGLKIIISEIVNHPLLTEYYNSNHTIYNERDIITKEGMILRPDRININNKNEAVIIDYKTGTEDKKHKQQLLSYQDVLEEMKIIVKRKILVYVNENIEIKEF